MPDNIDTHDTDLERLIEDIRELSAIPEFKKSLLYKVSELKVVLKEDIKDQREIEKMLCDVKKTETTDREGKVKGHEFELNRIGSHTWIPTIQGVREDLDTIEIMPGEIINFITRHNVNKGVPVMLPGLTFPGLKNRRFDLTFERKSEDFITGTIKEVTAAKKEIRIENQRVKTPDRHKLKYLKQLHQYLIEHDAFYFHVMSDFLTRWKPLIDTNNMEINEG